MKETPNGKQICIQNKIDTTNSEVLYFNISAELLLWLIGMGLIAVSEDYLIKNNWYGCKTIGMGLIAVSEDYLIKNVSL